MFRRRPHNSATQDPRGTTAAVGGRDHDDHEGTVLRTWLAMLPADVRAESSLTSLAAIDVVDCLADDASHLPAALGRFGAAVGGVGCALEDAARWLDELARLLGPVTSAPLQTFAAGLAVAEGWGQGSHYGLSQADTVDPLTGVATLGVTRLRISQVMDQCRALGIPAHMAYCVAVIDVDTHGLHGLERDATLVIVADRIQREFNSGETISYSSGRFLILTSYLEHTRTQILNLIAEIRSVPFIADRKVMGWIENLPELGAASTSRGGSMAAALSTNDVIDCFLLDLC